MHISSLIFKIFNLALFCPEAYWVEIWESRSVTTAIEDT
jgi:hypothetical protein